MLQVQDTVQDSDETAVQAPSLPLENLSPIAVIQKATVGLATDRSLIA